MSIETYIIRIYRRDPGDPRRLTGLLESVDSGTRSAFHTLNDLRKLLVPAADLEQQADKV